MDNNLGPEIQSKTYQVSMDAGLVRISVIGDDGKEIVRLKVDTGGALKLADAIMATVLRN